MEKKKLGKLHIWNLSKVAVSCILAAVYTSQFECSFQLSLNGGTKGDYGGYKTKRDLSLPAMWPHQGKPPSFKIYLLLGLCGGVKSLNGCKYL